MYPVLYNYPEFDECRLINKSLLSSYIYSYFTWWYTTLDRSYQYYIPNDNVEEQLLNNAFYKKNNDCMSGKTTIPAQGMSLYFNPLCTMPRNKIAGKFKRVLKLDNADVIVVPSIQISYKSMYYACFRKKDSDILYLLHVDPDKHQPLLGENLNQFLTRNKTTVSETYFSEHPTEAEYIKQLVCFHVGSMFKFNEKTSYIPQILNAELPVVFEEQLQTLLTDSDADYTEELLESINTLLGSKDMSSVKLGLQTMANLNYTKYPSLTKWLLNKNWKRVMECKPWPSNVKFMCKYLQASHFPPRDWYDNVQPYESTMVRKLITDDLNSLFNTNCEYYRKHSNLKLDVSWSINIEFPDNAGILSEEHTTNEPNEQKTVK